MWNFIYLFFPPLHLFLLPKSTTRGQDALFSPGCFMPCGHDAIHSTADGAEAGS